MTPISFQKEATERDMKYQKYNLVYGVSEPYMNRGDGKIHYVDTPYGRIANVICFDSDFPTYVSQVGKEKVDLLLVPSVDWKEIISYHTPATTFRAIENGCSFIRGTNKGLTLAVDYDGRTINRVNSFTTDEMVISDMPTEGVTTIYSVFGDLFYWLCCAGLAIVMVLGIIQSRKESTVQRKVISNK